MKFVLGAILVILGLSFGFMFLPALIGILFDLVEFDNGNVSGGIIAIVIGLAVQGLFFLYLFDGSVSGGSYSEDEYECPYCGSGDTDGNHCYTCDDDF